MRNGMRAMLAFAGAAVAWLTACGEPKVSMAPGPREYVASDYPQVLKRWTRSADLFALNELKNLLTVTSTYESWDFRWAYVVRYADDYRLTVEQRRELLDRTLAETREVHVFYLALYGSQRRWVDLTRPNTAWIVRLIDDLGNETAPSSVEGIPKPGPLEQSYFPYTTPWRQAFRIRFPVATAEGRPTVAPNARWIGLRFAGAEGNGELRWLVDPGPDPRGRPSQPPESSSSSGGKVSKSS